MTPRRGMRLPSVLALAALSACGPTDPGDTCAESFVAGDLVLTEVFADFAAPPGGSGTDDGKEWFELYNNTDRPVTLRGVKVVHSRPDGSKAATHFMEDVTIAPGQFFTLGNTPQAAVTAYVDYGYGTDLGDLYNSDGGKLALKCGETTIDEAGYDSVRPGRSRQLGNAAAPDYTLNDDLINWCEGKTAEFEENNFGTPGQESDCAPLVMGACNDSGMLRHVIPPAAGEIVITELMPDPAGDDALQEWFEVQALASFDLNGIGIGRIGDPTPTLVGMADCIPVSIGSYVVFAHNGDMAVNGGLPPGNVLGTFPSSTALTLGSTTMPGDLQLTLNGNVLDAVTWTSSRAAKSLQLDPDVTTAIANDNISNFCDGTTTYGSGGMGTPGLANAECVKQPPPGLCDPGTGSFREIVKPGANALVITEFLANPETTATGVDAAQEWFEIKNIGTTAFDLNGLTMQGSTVSQYTIQSFACKPVPAGGYALFAHSTDATINKGLPPVDVTFSFALGNTAGKIQIFNSTTLLDKVEWTTTASAPDGTSRQLQPATTNTVDNDSDANFCDALATQKYGTADNVGTPKADNACM